MLKSDYNRRKAPAQVENPILARSLKTKNYGDEQKSCWNIVFFFNYVSLLQTKGTKRECYRELKNGATPAFNGNGCFENGADSGWNISNGNE